MVPVGYATYVETHLDVVNMEFICASCNKRVSSKYDSQFCSPACAQKSFLTKKKRPLEYQGLGDVIHAGFKYIGVKPCGGCEQRRQILNRLIPNPWSK